MTSGDVPVALLVFNRPLHAARVIDALRAVRPTRLFVVADGPRPDHPDDVSRCAEVVRVLDERIDWQCTVERSISSGNLGCARRVASGLDWVFAQVEAAIVLEDDCVPDATFFPYCSELLARYRDDERIGMVTGCNLLGERPSNASYFFSHFADIWGWATWRRAWQLLDFEMKAWPMARDERLLELAGPGLGLERLWADAMERTYRGELDSWAYRWLLTMLRERMMSAVPRANLVDNIGHDEAATHTTLRSPFARIPTRPMSFPLAHPSHFVPSLEYEKRVHSLLRRGNRPLQSGTRRLFADALVRAADRAR